MIHAPPIQYRHAAPSGPWPWVDFNTDLSSSEPPFQKDEHEWRGYPQELFGNWSPIPVARSQMLTRCTRTAKAGCIALTVLEEKENEFWSKLQEESIVRENVRVRALFVDNMSESVLKMLGTKYNIEPFFFASSTNWIPSRYREEVQHGVGDRTSDHCLLVRRLLICCSERNERRNTIDVMSPLHLHGEYVLLIDLLAIHMIREKNSSTIITYHPALRDRTTAERLHQVMERAGGNPTFFFLAILWYALYAWDEAFEVLYNRIKDLISVTFVMETPNPAMEDSENKATTEELMQRECKNLLSEIDRLHRRCSMLISRLKNATDLAFATVNIEDSRQTFNSCLLQISYLTMIFLPASFTASVFGMNVREINPGSLETIARYVWVSLLLTFVTTWIVIRFPTIQYNPQAWS
ncbi:hypothetical protein F4604DRAFT_1877351 [Suillus subluteus]|nr:hypothetical protein F4604DRAFT_1877351 [Suillus subluteus]